MIHDFCKNAKTRLKEKQSKKKKTAVAVENGEGANIIEADEHHAELEAEVEQHEGAGAMHDGSRLVPRAYGDSDREIIRAKDSRIIDLEKENRDLKDRNSILEREV